MKSFVKFVLFIFIIDNIVCVYNDNVQDSTYCEFYNRETCTSKNSNDCTTRQQCVGKGPDTHNHCFTLWEYNAKTRESKVLMKGCFLNNKDCYEKSYCNQKNKNTTNRLYFCCCNGNMCNQNFTYAKFIEEDLHENQEKTVKNFGILSLNESEQQLLSLILAICVFFFIVTSTCISWYYRHRKFDYEYQISNLEKGQCSIQQPENDEQKYFENNLDYTTDTIVELVEQKASGRFGAVWAARRAGETVAVKVFPLRDQQSWLTEFEIFRLPRMDHEDILQFFGAHKNGVGLDCEFWLITAYHEKGSLCDYLTENVITWNETLLITLSIARGLNHLHREIISTKGQCIDDYKPAVAHRDFKSKNVLLKADMSACIADFGLALIFRPDSTCGNQHGRVGTLRYMAPEVLDGAINFSKESFLAIDMYACGLVFWEVASRCAVDNEEFVSEYKSPFEKELGSKPTLEEMNEYVVRHKKRPQILETWKKHEGLSAICDTIEECWDHDTDARLSSSCVLDRMTLLKREFTAN